MMSLAQNKPTLCKRRRGKSLEGEQETTLLVVQKGTTLLFLANMAAGISFGKWYSVSHQRLLLHVWKKSISLLIHYGWKFDWILGPPELHQWQGENQAAFVNSSIHTLTAMYENPPRSLM